MTSRERILAAINHQEPDRVPIDCGAMRSTGIQAIAYNRLKALLKMNTGHTQVFDVIQQIAEPESWYLDKFGIDAINAGREFASARWQDWRLPDGSACQMPAYIRLVQENRDWLACNQQGRPVARMIRGATYFSQSVYPFADEQWAARLPETAREMGSSVCWGSLPEPMYEGGLTQTHLHELRAHLRALRDRHHRAIMIAFGANLLEWASYLRRMDNFLMDLAANPIEAEALLDKLVEIHLAGLDKLLPAVGDYVDLIQLGDDLGMQKGPIVSVPMFRRFFKPRYQIITRHIKRLKPHIRIFLHCCGGVYPLIADLIEAGFEVLNPVQINAKDMEPARLKRDFGKNLTFWGGGCDTQAVLARGTPQQVKDHVRRNIDTFAPGGGFVFCQVHNILAEVPPENIVAMYEAATA